MPERVERGIDINDPVSLYFRDATNNSPLSIEEEKSLVGEVENLKETLILYNTRLVVEIASKYKGKGTPFLDLIQEGNIGLVESVNNYDINSENKLSTFAYRRIRGEILNALDEKSRIIKLPNEKVDLLNEMKSYINKYQNSYGELPTYKDIAEKFDEKEEDVVKLFSVDDEFLRIDSDYFDNELQTPFEEGNLYRSKDFTEIVDNKIIADNLNLIIDKYLSKTESQIIRLYHGIYTDEHNFREISVIVGGTKEWARIQYYRAIDKLKNVLDCEFR